MVFLGVRTRARFLCTTAAVLAASYAGLSARQSTVDVSTFNTFAWRSLGPFRGGRTTVAVGIPAQPNVMFAGTANGGVWKTTDAGRTWRPVFDRENTGAIGSIAVAPTNANIVYVGTGEAPLHRHASRGTGLFRSDDGGQTWRSTGLTDHRHLSTIVIDSKNPERLFVASAGSGFGAESARGVYRSTDGGRTFERVYFKDDQTGALDLLADPADSSVLYGSLLQTHFPAGRALSEPGPGTGVIKSTDGGATWFSSQTGLPTFERDGLRRIRLALAPSSRTRLYAVVEARTGAGLYRSDDAGGSWTLVHPPSPDVDANHESTAPRVDPSNPDVVYLTGPRVMRSTDGGRTFSVWRTDSAAGAYRSLWINPMQPSIAMLSGDRGAVVTVNGGDTWSSPFNQPTGEFHDVVTDTAFPYRICGSERESPPGCLPSRGVGGRIAPSEWQLVGPLAGTRVVPDPHDPDLVYSGAVSRFDRRNGQLQDVRVPSAEEAQVGGPLAFSSDGRTLYFGANVVWRGTGPTWSVISPELSRPDSTTTVAISSVAPSLIDGRLIWAGTDDGSIHVTRDGGTTWTRSTPPVIQPWWRISSLEPSHFDANTAYVSAVASSLGDDRPYIFRTRDGGASWQPISSGLPEEATVYAVREDMFRRGLLFASTRASVFVSFDDGERWQSLRLNLPPVPVTDLTVKDADLIISTNGRGFYVMDDVSPFRQITADLARAGTFLFRPATAWRTQQMQPIDSSALRDEPSAVNPPDGVAISYMVSSGTTGPVTIEIIETLTGDLIRRYTREASPGFHRLMWDLQYTPVEGKTIWVMPGTYQVRLTVGSQVVRQAVVVRMDPRVRVSATDLAAQFKMSRAVYDRRQRLVNTLGRLQDTAADRERGVALRRVAADLDRALDLLQQADTRPTAPAEALANAAVASADAALGVE
jgi:photosystem II stability/assembly factor-like uncharacterized protein